MRKILPLTLVALLVASCSKHSGGTGLDAIVKVNDQVLTKEKLDEKIPPGLTAEDSTMAAEYYIRSWINDNLKYAIASKNRVNAPMIENLVADYRKSLTIYQYEEQLVNEKLSKSIDDNLLRNYYEENRDKFKTDVPLFKGLFLKVPVNAPQIDKVRLWYKAPNDKNITNIENYCVKNGANYGSFLDQWVKLDNMMENLPGSYRLDYDDLKQAKDIEKQDDNYYYFLHVTAYLPPGENAPFEYAKPVIKEILINQRKIDFLKQVEEDLYNKALNNRQITFYNN
ncbi:MAG: peptidyl-prolyl cis-trans isomerase [Dysgonamonadaceae bacterium]|jgi:hypothetical protein|nr:peptidyl-prolyl cis-trans isomerase [Dysgonamonadaceae bacterium]